MNRLSVANRITLMIFSILLIVLKVNAMPELYHANHIRHQLNAIEYNNEFSGKNLKEKHLASDRQQYHRIKRQFDFSVEADHEDGIGTDILAEASANLYKSISGETRLDATARYSQHFSESSSYGKAKIGGSLHFKHNY